MMPSVYLRRLFFIVAQDKKIKLFTSTGYIFTQFFYLLMLKCQLCLTVSASKSLNLTISFVAFGRSEQISNLGRATMLLQKQFFYKFKDCNIFKFFIRSAVVTPFALFLLCFRKRINFRIAF